jgi:hypothetical protein
MVSDLDFSARGLISATGISSRNLIEHVLELNNKLALSLCFKMLSASFSDPFLSRLNHNSDSLPHRRGGGR